MKFSNVYEDDCRAGAYAKLEFPGTYYLAYRDLPRIISEHVRGKSAVDFGCGAGRSTRFLKKHGFDAVGVDVSGEMIQKAKELDPAGEYHLVPDGDLSRLRKGFYDLVLSVFTFDNIEDPRNRVGLLKQIRELLNGDGRAILLDSTPEIYSNEWASFTTKEFPENRNAKSGERVRIVMTDVEDRRPVEDIIWFEKDYMDLFEEAGAELAASYKPLAKEDEPYAWVNETKIAPWVIYVLR
jgi:SAM-dependent methyltransferase